MKNAIWSSAISMVSIGSNPCKRSSHKPYTIVDVRKIVNRRRAKEVSEGKPRRRTTPVTPWLLDECVDLFIVEDSEKYELEMIIIQDKRE